MDNTDPIVPMFTGELKHGAAALTDFFLIPTASDVPVTKIIIVADGRKYKFSVELGRHRVALFLLYCAVLRQQPSFVFDFVLRDMLKPYFGDEIVANAGLSDTMHKTLQPIVQGRDVEVSLVLKPGYELPKGPGRTVRRLIEHGWSEHERFRPDTSVPLVREALKAFWQADRSGKLRIIQTWDSKVWPNLYWQERVWTLTRVLGLGRAA